MIVRLVSLVFCLILCAMLATAGELHTELFTETPTLNANELLQPRVIFANAATNRCYILDSGLNRVIAVAADGRAVMAWPYADEGAMPADPLLPSPALAGAKDAVYLLRIDRTQRQVDLVALDGPGHARTITLPDGMGNGAVTLDDTDRLLVAALRVAGTKTTLVVAREGEDGVMTPILTHDNPCDDQTKSLALTGFTLSNDGRLALGIAQSGDTAYSFTRSWLVQGTLHDGVVTGIKTTHRFSLLDARGKVLDRFRAAQALTGRNGFPVKPCVPLFTALALTPGGSIISAGHTLDPFFRVYGSEGRLLLSRPRQAIGGQTLTVLPVKEGGFRLFATQPAQSRVEEVTLDGRIIGELGRPVSFLLTHPLALAAAPAAVYALVKYPDGLYLLRFARDGRFLWARATPPPKGMENATPFLDTVPSGDHVLIGWRQPDTAGLGWVETVMDDGTPGLPLWPEVYVKSGLLTTALPQTPLVVGENGRLYVLRETKDGSRVQAFSVSGALLQQLPPAIQGVFTVAADGSFGTAGVDADGFTITRFTRDGVSHGWKRVPRPAGLDDRLLPACAKGLWAWLTATKSLVHFDDTLTLVDESSLYTPEGDRIDQVQSIAGDRENRLYLALPDRILLLQAP